MGEVGFLVDAVAAGLAIGGGDEGFGVVLATGGELGSAVVAGVGEGFERGVGRKSEVLLRLLGHGMKLAEVVAILGDFAGGDEVVLAVNRSLDVVADGGLAALVQLA